MVSCTHCILFIVTAGACQLARQLLYTGPSPRQPFKCLAPAPTVPPLLQVRLLLLAALCGEHLLLLGPPGTAKSELSRRLSKLTGGRYFERLLTRFSVPEELFGPLSMRGLENDQ